MYSSIFFDPGGVDGFTQQSEKRGRIIECSLSNLFIPALCDDSRLSVASTLGLSTSLGITVPPPLHETLPFRSFS
jgi:hypothetical protein